MIPDGVKVMDMSFDVRKVFQERLASSMGLDKYRYIMEQVSITNVAIDTDFQRTFNGFYVVRRNESWRKSYYEYFESVKNGKPTFKNIITYLYECTGNIEPSFSSKMLATIIPEKPIWDRYVVQNLNMQLTGMVLCQYLVQVKMRNFSHFNPPEAQPQCVFFHTIVRIHLVTYSYNGYEFVSYCRKLPDIRKSSSMPACNREF